MTQKWGHFWTPFLPPFGGSGPKPHIYIGDYRHFWVPRARTPPEGVKKGSQNGVKNDLKKGSKNDPIFDDILIIIKPTKFRKNR